MTVTLEFKNYRRLRRDGLGVWRVGGRRGGGGEITVEAVAAIFLMTDCGEARRRSIVCPDL